VYRYHNRNPPDDLTTRDHRLELIKKGDVRDAQRNIVGFEELKFMMLKIKKCFLENKVLYTSHAKTEMRDEEFGNIFEIEVCDAIEDGEIIENYSDDKPYPSVLIYGKSSKGKPLHVVCAYSDEDDIAIVVTVYQPNPKMWIDYRRRKK